jgi:large conductance mechanosensitive channel
VALRDMFTGFKDFISRGNVIDLAVAVVIGAAFNAVVQALVKDILTPLIAAIFGQPDFSNLTFTINGSQFKYGDLLNNVINFLIVAVAIYFFVVLPLNHLAELRNRHLVETPTTRECPECLTVIPIAARRCSACGVESEPKPVGSDTDAPKPV